MDEKITIVLWDYSSETLKKMLEDLNDNLEETDGFYDEEEIQNLQFCKDAIQKFLKENYDEESNMPEPEDLPEDLQQIKEEMGDDVIIIEIPMPGTEPKLQ